MLSGNWGANEILSKKDRRRREHEMRRVPAPLVGNWVNVSLRDGSTISKVYLEIFQGKRLLRYSTSAGDVLFVALAEVDMVTAVSLEVKWLQEHS